MSDAPSPRPDPEPELNELMVRCIDRIAEFGASGADEVLAAHPNQASELSRRLQKLHVAGLLPGADEQPAAIPERLGDFRLLRTIGAGGMGVVYLAVQESLGREVALKLVRPEQLYFPGARERFRREVEAIARLQDPGIVAVHTVGEDSGVPYFAMELVVGATLTDLVLALQDKATDQLRGPDLFAALHQVVPALDSTPIPENTPESWPELCAQLLAQVVRAVGHAHAQGVLHRDLKSSNVMLRGDGRTAVLDFGLAQSRGASRMTRSGAPVGTLHAMAPEQLRGDQAEVDERTDVYALGVLFYELLTLRPPYVGDSYDAVARLVLDANPMRPSRRNAAVPWDYETVCLTAMDASPQRRYPSASALLRDIENLLAHRTIQAKRPGPLLRLRRFGERNKVLSAAAAVALAALLALPVVIAVREHGHNEVLRATIDKRDREMARADANVAAAAAALGQLLVDVADAQLEEIPDLRELNRDLLGKTATQVEALLDSNPDDAAIRLSFAETLTRASMLRWSLRENDAADKLLRRALALLAQEHAATRAVDPDRFDLLRLDVRLALALLRFVSTSGDGYDAELRDILREAEAHAPAAERPPKFRVRFAAGLQRLAARRSTEAGEADALLRRAIALLDSSAASTPDVDTLLTLAQAHRQLARRLPEAERVLASAAEEAAVRRAAATPTQDMRARGRVAPQLRIVGQRLILDGRRDEGVELLRAVVKICDEVADARPSRVQVQLDRLSARESLAHAIGRAGASAERLRLFEDIATGTRTLVSTWPDRAAAWIMLAHARLAIYDERLAALDRDGAARQLSASVRELELADRRAPDLAVLRFARTSLLAAQAGHALLEDRVADARQLVRDAAHLEREARVLGRAQSVTLGVNERLLLAMVELDLRDGDRESALARLSRLKDKLDFDPFLWAPGLRAVRDEPGFDDLLRDAPGR